MCAGGVERDRQGAADGQQVLGLAGVSDLFGTRVLSPGPSVATNTEVGDVGLAASAIAPIMAGPARRTQSAVSGAGGVGT